MSAPATDGDLENWIELHGPLTPVDALVLLNQICAELEQLAATGLSHHDLVPTKVLLRSEEDGLVPILHDVSAPLPGNPPPGLDALLWTMLSGVPAPGDGLPRLGGNDHMSAGFNMLFDLLAANGSRTTGLREIRAALVRLANRARSEQAFTPIPIRAAESFATQRVADEDRPAIADASQPEPVSAPRQRPRASILMVLAAGVILALAAGLVAFLSR